MFRDVIMQYIVIKTTKLKGYFRVVYTFKNILKHLYLKNDIRTAHMYAE